jgi:5-amino-6-(5-phosphoribosylamino)uracil reductase
LSCAITLDGYLDDRAPGRLMLSSPEDRDQVDAIRAAADAIVVGAGTIRHDDPALTVRSEARRAARRMTGQSGSPLRVVLVGMRGLPAAARILTDHDVPTLLYASDAARAALAANVGRHVTIVGVPPGGLRSVLSDLASRGARRVLIEGGQRLSTAALKQGVADVLRLALAPVVLGRCSAPRLAGAVRGRAALRLPLRLVDSAMVGLTGVLTYTRDGAEAAYAGAGFGGFVPHSEEAWLAEAIEMAGRCTPSGSAYSVGAWIVNADGEPVAHGYSRETDGAAHAEEVALRKAAATGADFRACVLFSSMEPCSVRLSGRTPCCTHIMRAGIGRVVFAESEPPVFVRCRGAEVLAAGGVEVRHVRDLAPYAAERNAHIAQSGTPTPP